MVDMTLRNDGVVEIEIKVETLRKIFSQYPFQEDQDEDIAEFAKGVKQCVEFYQHFQRGKRL